MENSLTPKLGSSCEYIQLDQVNIDPINKLFECVDEMTLHM